MKTKTEFLTIKPKTKEAKDFFEIYMRELHSCKVLERKENKVLLDSIAGNCVFWMNEKEDAHWEVIK